MSATTLKPVWSPETGPDHLPVNDIGATGGMADGGVDEAGGAGEDEAGGAGEFVETDAVGPGVDTSAPFLPALLLRMTTVVIATAAASTTAAARPIATVRRLPSRGLRPPGGRGGGCGTGARAVGASRVSPGW